MIRKEDHYRNIFVLLTVLLFLFTSCSNIPLIGKKKEEKVERNITLRKLKSEEDEAHAQKTNGHGSLVTPGQGQTAGGQQGEAIPDRKRDEETPDLPMRKEEAVFDEGKDG